MEWTLLGLVEESTDWRESGKGRAGLVIIITRRWYRHSNWGLISLSLRCMCRTSGARKSEQSDPNSRTSPKRHPETPLAGSLDTNTPPTPTSTSTMDDPVDGSLIENVKENIVPSRDGRSAQAISQLYSVPRAQRAKELSATHSHYRELINAIPADAPLPNVQPDDELEARDPLAFYCQYVGWIMDNYPEGSSTESGLLTVLEEATRRFCGKEVYKDDERYIKLWIEYANLVEQSERVFAFMLANDIGSVFPTPYEEFAVILERNKQ